MDMGKLQRQLDAAKGGIEDITKVLSESEEAGKGLVNAMSDLSGIGSRKGIMRSIITRMSAGNATLFKMTQQASSLLLVFRFIDKSREETAKKEAEVNELLEKRDMVLRRLYKLEVDKNVDNLTALEKEQYYNNASIKHMMKSMSLSQALGMLQKKLHKARNGMLKDNDKIMKKSRRAFARQNRGISGLNNTGEKIGKFGLGGFAGRNMDKKSAVIMAEQEKAGYEERIKALTEEREYNQRERDWMNEQLATGDLNKADERNAKKMLDKYDQLEEGFKSAIEKVTEDLGMITSSQKDMIADLRRSGTKIIERRNMGQARGQGQMEFLDEKMTLPNLFEFGGDKLGKMILGEKLYFLVKGWFMASKSKGFWKSIKSVGKFAKDSIKKGFGKAMDKLKQVDWKKSMKNFGKNLKGIAKFALVGLALMTGLGIIIYLIARSGFFEKVIKHSSAAIEFLTGALMGTLTGVYIFFLGVWDILAGVVDFISSAFRGDLKGMGKALLRIGKGVLEMALGIFMTAFYGLMFGAGGVLALGYILIASVADTLWSNIRNIWTEIKENGIKTVSRNAVMGAVQGLGLGVIAGGLVGGALGSFAGPGGTIAGAKAGAILGGKIGVVAGGLMGAGGSMESFASGGITPMGGQFLVGENGPELVTLPGNTSITNNTNTRGALGTTINVHVNGRVGASEQELNQLADKIGQKISMRMNRFSPTGMRG